MADIDIADAGKDKVVLGQTVMRKALLKKVPKLRAVGSSSKPGGAKKNLTMVLRQWHQRAGLFAFLFMAWLGISGVLLNQSASWGLDALRVKSAAVMSMYGLYPRAPETGYVNASHWLVNTTENTVVDGHLLDRHIPSPVGFSALGEDASAQIFVATKDKLTLVDAKGSVIDEISDYMLPVAAINQIGVLPATSASGQRVVVKGESSYATGDGMVWEALDSDVDVQWSVLTDLSEEIKAKVLPFARPTVALEQLLIDMHSGRFFGRFGPWVINTVGILCVWLSISGIWMMWRSNRRRRK
ncbi:PepSY domain-containing protein [Spongiibacter taiwanensis]|uniref:PepSY domain-containing protein n=1 Tax=Spongiibacter taiwanensis TaxID=1748242 RepID=UPI00203619ED|nr:PepSY domain-containing protein [Spongiibacter taiwanensis]USA44392.1 PepSY domain-containing protein [Spongiibacter taiwanensis]